MQYYFTSSAVKDLRGLEVGIRKRIIEKLDFYTSMDDPLAFAKPLRDHAFGEYRFRAGEFRIVFDVRDEGIVVLAIGNRKDIYR